MWGPSTAASLSSKDPSDHKDFPRLAGATTRDALKPSEAGVPCSDSLTGFAINASIGVRAYVQPRCWDFISTGYTDAVAAFVQSQQRLVDEGNFLGSFVPQGLMNLCVRQLRSLLFRIRVEPPARPRIQACEPISQFFAFFQQLRSEVFFFMCHWNHFQMF